MAQCLTNIVNDAAALGPTHIARLMCVTVETVKSHLKEARWELRARTTAEAVANALRQGLIR